MADKCKKVLIVDDDSKIPEMYRDYLSKKGYEVFTATNGKEGLEAFKNNGNFPVIVADIEMPVMDGFEMVKEIRKISPFTRVLFLTGKIIEDGHFKNSMALQIIRFNGMLFSKPLEDLMFLWLALEVASNNYWLEMKGFIK